MKISQCPVCSRRFRATETVSTEDTIIKLRRAINECIKLGEPTGERFGNHQAALRVLIALSDLHNLWGEQKENIPYHRCPKDSRYKLEYDTLHKGWFCQRCGWFHSKKELDKSWRKRSGLPPA